MSAAKNLKHILGYIGSVPQFEKLNREEMNILSDYIKLKNVLANMTLCKENSPGDSMFYVIKGTIEISKESIDGRRKILPGERGKGFTIGEMSLLENRPRSATVKAIEDVKLLILTRNDFDVILNRHPKIGIKILRNLAKALSDKLRSLSSQFVDLID